MEVADEEGQEQLEVVPLFSEFGQAGFRLYGMDLASLGLAEEDTAAVLAMVVFTRKEGFLVALPELALPAEALVVGNSAGAEDLVGPSLAVEVCCAVLDEEAITRHPSTLEGKTISVVLVDFSHEAFSSLFLVEDKQTLDELTPFDLLEAFSVPDPANLVARASAWAQGREAEPTDRIQFYSADEVPETPPLAPSAKRASRRKAPGVGTDGGVPGVTKKKATVASLAENMETLLSTLPAITQKLQDLQERTEAIETRDQRGPDRVSALRKPLGGSATSGLLAPSQATASLLQQMPPPRNTSSSAKPQKVTFSQTEAQEYAMETNGEGSDLAKAMLEQSKALMTLVAQLASSQGDPMYDLGTSTSSLSTKGALSRARLQNELAAHRGTFFNSVIHSMARRMNPALQSEVELSVLKDRGVSPTLYLERFGGYGKCRDIGFINWQVAMVMNYMMEENFMAAKDALSLLFVCLEQTSMDGGSMQVGLLLSLQEDPPQSLFTNRSLATAALPRPFAPTAHQRWITTALQYLKEMDVISTRRAEVAGGKNTSDRQGGASSSQDTNPNPGPKKKPKGKGGGKNQKGQSSSQTQEEDTVT